MIDLGFFNTVKQCIISGIYCFIVIMTIAIIAGCALKVTCSYVAPAVTEFVNTHNIK